MTHQFFCHYTGKDGVTPRRRLQTLTFFDHVPSIGNSTSSPTPLWVEVIGEYYMFHAQLSDTVAVYTELQLHRHSIEMLNQTTGMEERRAMLTKLITDLLDYTSLLISYPKAITPHVLAAYKEARPEEYEQLALLTT